MSSHLERVGGRVVSVVALEPFAWLWVAMMANAEDLPTLRTRLDMAIWMAVFGAPWVLAARLLWRAWWRQAGTQLSSLDGPGLLLAAAAPGPAWSSPAWRWRASVAASPSPSGTCSNTPPSSGATRR